MIISAHIKYTLLLINQWRQPWTGMVSDVVPLYKLGKGDRYECSNMGGIRLLRVVGGLYDRVMIK